MTFALYLRLWLHVRASNIDVIRACRTKIAEHHLWCSEMKEVRKQFYRSAIDYHRQARAVAQLAGIR